MTDIVTDKAGRKIQLRRIGVLDHLRLFKALGPELSENVPYMRGALIAAAVAMIDDVPVPLPVNEAALEATLDRIGLETMPLIAKAMTQRPERELAAEAGN